MKLGKGMNRCFIAANMIGGLLQSNLDAKFLRRAVKFAGLHVQANTSKFGEHPYALLRKNRPVYLQMMTNDDCCVILNHYETSLDDKQVPKISFLDVLYGSVECLGRFEVLAWRSRIPPIQAVRYKSNSAWQLHRQIHQLLQHLHICCSTCVSSLFYKNSSNCSCSLLCQIKLQCFLSQSVSFVSQSLFYSCST
jgi:hypothetical protein